MIQRYVLFVGLLALTVAIAVAMKRPPAKSQSPEDHAALLKFSHAAHVKDRGIGCADCHTAATTSTLSSDFLMATHEACQSCHEEQLSSNCTFCHTSAENIEPMKNPPREIIFSHELHASKQNIACETCHAGLDTVAYASKANFPAMTTCMTCHTDKKVSTNCETCHTNFTSLIPPDHVSGDFRKDHSKFTRVGMQNVECITCHTESFCQDCHTGMELKSFYGSRDLMTDPSVRSSTKDSPRQLRLQQVHSLNYRYTHGIDVRSKALDCAACHETQSFCAECHEAGGEITQSKIKPATHRQAGFVTIGRGSGGGLHAELARRDLESCASCHDVEGSDPVCMTCHTETGTVR